MTVRRGADGNLTFRLYAAEPDCTVPVLWDDRAPSGLDVDAGGNPVEPYGVGRITWQ